MNDWLLKVNDVDLANKDRKQVIKAVLSGEGVINMVVRRRKSLGGRIVTPVQINLVGHKGQRSRLKRSRKDPGIVGSAMKINQSRSALKVKFDLSVKLWLSAKAVGFSWEKSTVDVIIVIILPLCLGRLWHRPGKWSVCRYFGSRQSSCQGLRVGCGGSIASGTFSSQELLPT